jgi:peptidoglycan/LPS O-acetylase OafA/YrhL
MPDSGRGKVEYLEGLRGIAAMQVVLLHFVTGFLPYTAEHAWPPLRVVFDGHTAVYVFFLISGAVLTPSFARPGGFLAKLGKRVVRLGIPVAVAAAIATVLLALLPDAHLRAARLTGSAWLAMDSSGAPTLAHLAREIGLDSLLLGYREATLFAPLADHLPLMEYSLDAPFWSLHLELYGSLLVLGLVSLRAHSRWLYRVAVAAAALLFGTHPMFLFVLGHLSAPLLVRPRGRSTTVLGASLLVLGAAMCATKDWRVVEALRLWLSHSELASAPNLFQFQSQLGAVVMYFGVLLCPGIWRVLESGTCRRLGRLSFSIYLLHFPILFTVVCAVFIRLRHVMPYSASVAVAFALFLTLTLLAAMLFERWIDRPAIAISRRAGNVRWQAA